MENFEAFAIVAVVGARAFTFLAFVMALFAGFRLHVGELIFSTFVFALFSPSVLFTFRANALMKSISGAFCAARVALTAN